MVFSRTRNAGPGLPVSARRPVAWQAVEACRKPFSRTAVALGVLLLTASASAQETEDLAQMSLEDLLSVSTVTASGGNIEERASASANVIVVSRDDIRNNGWRSVKDVLSNVPGLYVIDDGSVTSVNVRGITAGLRGGTRLVKVMINGVPVNFRPDLRAFIGPEYIPIDAVERIEVVKGPLSALYGANAFLATVNIITREPAIGTTAEASTALVNTHGEPGYGGSLMTTFGSERATALIAVSAWRLDRSGLGVARTYPAQDPTLPRFRPYFDDVSRDDISVPTSVFVQLGLPKRSFGSLTLNAGVQHLDSMAEFQLNSVLTHESRESLVNRWLVLKHDHEWSKSFSTAAMVGYSNGSPAREDRFFLTQNRTQTFVRNFGYEAVNGALAATFAPSDDFSLRLGCDVEADWEDVLYYTAILNTPQGNRQPGDRQDLISASMDRSKLLSDVGAYVQVSGKLPALEKLSLTGNLRVDRPHYDDFGPPPQISARASAVYEWGPWLTSKLVAGRAFQTPSGVLMFAQPGFGVRDNVLGNLTPGSAVPRVEPQTMTSAEAILYSLLGDVASLELSVFYQELTDKIDFENSGANYVAVNSGSSDYIGLEGRVQFSFWQLSPYAEISAVRELRDGKIVDEALPSYPKNSGKLGLRLDVYRPRLYLSTQLRRVGERGATAPNVTHNLGTPYALPAYTTVDASLSTGGLPIFGEPSKTYFVLTASNLLDERYSEPGFGGYDVPAVGRTAMFEIRNTL